MTGPRVDEELQARPATHGPTISDRIGEAITEAWAKLQKFSDGRPSPDEEFKAQQARGRILGLAQALAILRTAPNSPSADLVREIANEFRPEVDR